MVHLIEKGDIFAISGVTSYAHGCNCAGAMGKGIAVQFREKFPEMYLEYKELCRKGLFNPGDVYDYAYGGGYVYNLGTQKTWRTRAQIPFIEESIGKMMSLATASGVDKIALPAIGAGLGGLDWADVKAAIGRVAADYPAVDLFVVERYSAEPTNII